MGRVCFLGKLDHRQVIGPGAGNQFDRVEADLLEQFPGTELLIHIDPEGHVDEPDNPLVEDNEFAKLEKDA